MRAPLREAVTLEQPPRAFFPHLAQHAARGREIMKVLPRRQLVVEQRHLRCVADGIVAPHLARVRRQEPREDAHQRRLPAAVLPADPHDFTAAHRQIHTVEHLPPAEPLGEPTGLEHRAVRYHRPTCRRWNPYTPSTRAEHSATIGASGSRTVKSSAKAGREASGTTSSRASPTHAITTQPTCPCVSRQGPSRGSARRHSIPKRNTPYPRNASPATVPGATLPRWSTTSRVRNSTAAAADDSSCVGTRGTTPAAPCSRTGFASGSVQRMPSALGRP